MRDVLERLTVPEQEPRFFEELRTRMQEQDRRAARRWRRLTVGLGTLTVAAVAAAAVVAATRGGGSVVDRTVSCPTQSMSGVHEFGLMAMAIPHGFDYATLIVSTGQPQVDLFGSDTRFTGYSFDRSCRPLKERIPLTRGKLPSVGTYRAGAFGSGAGFSGRCLLGGRVELHVLLHLDGSGKPESAVIAVRMQKKHRPIAFVQWSPKKVTAYLSSACTTS